MKPSPRFLLALYCLCASLAPRAVAQPAGDPSIRIRPLQLRPPSVVRDAGQQWVASLESAGLVNRALPAPYRVAVPLMNFGDAGSQLKLTYGNNGGSGQSRGVVLFFTMELP